MLTSIIFTETENWIPLEPASPWVLSKTQKEQKWHWGENLGHFEPVALSIGKVRDPGWVVLKVNPIQLLKEIKLYVLIWKDTQNILNEKACYKTIWSHEGKRIVNVNDDNMSAYIKELEKFLPNNG